MIGLFGREKKVRVQFYGRDPNPHKGRRRQRYQFNGLLEPRIPLYRRLLHLPRALCPLLFTALVHDRVNYGETGFHKFRDEIWSDKFNSQDPAPGSRRARVTRVAHT